MSLKPSYKGGEPAHYQIHRACDAAGRKPKVGEPRSLPHLTTMREAMAEIRKQRTQCYPVTLVRVQTRTVRTEQPVIKCTERDVCQRIEGASMGNRRRKRRNKRSR